MSDPKESDELRIGASVSKETPTVSVIIPYFNSRRFIAATLDSVLAQTFTNYELIVVNDASPDTDHLLKVIEGYREKIVFLDRRVNGGAAAARNSGVDQARADLIAFLDSDDIWYPSFLEEMCLFRETNDFDMVYTAAEIFGGGQGSGSNFLNNNPAQGEISRRDLILGKCLILPSGTVIKKDVFRSMHGFDPAIPVSEDFDLWMRMIFQTKRIGFLRKVLFRYRLRTDSLSGDSIGRINSSRNIWIDMKQRLPFTDEEKSIVDRHIGGCDAALLRVNGRLSVVQKDWGRAKDNFRLAAKMAGELGLPFKHRVKLSASLLLLRLSPGLLRSLFLRFRQAEAADLSAEPEPDLKGSAK